MLRSLKNKIVFYMFLVMMLAFGQTLQAEDGQEKEYEEYELFFECLEMGETFYREIPKVTVTSRDDAISTVYKIRNCESEYSEILTGESSISLESFFTEGDNELEIWMAYEGEIYEETRVTEIFKIDTRGPKIENIEVSGNVIHDQIVNNGVVFVSVAASDFGSGIKAVEYMFLDKKDDAQMIEETREGGFWIEIREEFRSPLKIRAIDQAGNQSDWINTKEIINDSTAPVVSIREAHKLSVWQKKYPTIQIVIEDKGISLGISFFQITINGKLIYQENSKINQWQRQWKDIISQESVNKEPVAITIQGHDYAGNKFETHYSIWIDINAPRIQIEGIEEEKYYNQSIKGCINIEDENEIQKQNVRCKFLSFDELEKNYKTITLEKDENQKYNMNLEQDGFYCIEVEATDLAGNYSSQKICFVKDGKKPVIKYIDRLKGIYCKEFVWNYKDCVEDSTATTVLFQLNGKSYQRGERLVREGLHFFEIKAIDSADNESISSAKFIIDRTPPEISVLGVEQDGIYMEKKEVIIELSEKDDWINRISVNGKEQDLSDFCKQFNLSFQQYKEYRIWIEASDYAGNKECKELRFEIKSKETYKEVMKQTRERKENKIQEKETRKTNSLVVIVVAGLFAFIGIKMKKV